METASESSPLVEFLTSSPFLILASISAFIGVMWIVWSLVGRALVTKPRVRLEFGKTQGVDGEPALLTCDFFNDQLVGGMFSVLNIKRENIEEFWILPRLFDMNGNVICDIDNALHDRLNQHDDTFQLPASVHGLRWAVVSFDDVGPSLINDRGIQAYLPPDTYEVRFFLHADEVDVRVVGHRFVVGIHANLCQWVGKPYKVSATRLLSWQGIRRLLRRPPPL